MASHGYKKYMKKEVQNNGSLLKIFIISFFGMLLVFTFLIKSFSPTVDTSIGDYKEQQLSDDYEVKPAEVDERLSYIQDEDRGKSFKDLMSKAQDAESKTVQNDVVEETRKPLSKTDSDDSAKAQPPQDTVYKVYVGTYTSADQAKVAKDIIQESGVGLNPIVKCIGSNNYTLQVGLFKSKQSAESMLYSVQQNHLPGRIVQE